MGSNCVLVAPVTIGAGGTIGGGSTVTKSTEPGALTIARARQASFAELAAAEEGAQRLKRPIRGRHPRPDRRQRQSGSGTRGANFARLTLKKAFTLRTLASLVNRRCASAW